jgi:hypothetical protein
VHTALSGPVDIDTEHRQHASEVDTHLVNARRDQRRVVLPRLARHEFLPRPLSELADEAGAERPVAGPANHTHDRRYRWAVLGRGEMSSSETGAVSTKPVGRLSRSTRAWKRRRMPRPRVRSLRVIELAAFGVTMVTCLTTSAPRQIRHGV